MKLREAVEKFLQRRIWQIFILLIGYFLLYFALILVDVVIGSTPMLQSLIQADATVLGFFGVIAAYSLTSYDSRIDRFEQQRFDLALKGQESVAKEIFIRIVFIRKRKRETAQGIAIVSGLLILSLVLGIILLGANNINNSILIWLLAFGTLGFFFVGLGMIFFLFYQMSWEAGRVG
jgi:hypothetical protein